MKHIVRLVLGLTVLALLISSSAYAQATRTWVSGVGDDVNPCSRTAPCKTFAGAISKTLANGVINCLDPGGFGAVTVTKSIVIDCHDVPGSVLVSGTNGIVINGTGITVTLRNLQLDGVQSGLNGINIVAAKTVFIEDCAIEGFTQRGINDQRTSGGQVWVTNTTMRSNTGAGFGLADGTSQASLSNVLSGGNGFGVAIGGQATIQRSMLSANTIGVEAEGTAAVIINESSISSNGTGLQPLGASNIVLANTDITFNATALTGTVNSYGNNRFGGNASIPGTIAPIGTTSNPTGQR
jgi:hypothetical protein